MPLETTVSFDFTCSHCDKITKMTLSLNGNGLPMRLDAWAATGGPKLSVGYVELEDANVSRETTPDA
jgi:hypothetical protein